MINYNVRHAKHVSCIVAVCIVISPNMYLILLTLSFDFHSLILLCIHDLASSLSLLSLFFAYQVRKLPNCSTHRENGGSRKEVARKTCLELYRREVESMGPSHPNGEAYILPIPSHLIFQLLFYFLHFLCVCAAVW